MGVQFSNGPMPAKTIQRVFDPSGKFKSGRNLFKSFSKRGGSASLAAYSILGGMPEAIVEGQNTLASLRDAAHVDASSSRQTLDRSFGCVLGNAIGDALGAPLEFSAVRYGSDELKGFNSHVWRRLGYNAFGVRPGQWTDDNAMGLCLADSLLVCNGFDPYDLRQRFGAWINYGYNNAFGRDPGRSDRSSVGLGGNISMSITEWAKKGEAMTTAGDEFTNGNGSVMRNGAVPVWFRNDLQGGMEAAYRQSRTTHRGEEAGELCRLLTYICVQFINGKGRELLDDLSGFKSKLYTVTCLANAVCEEHNQENSNPIFGGLDRRR